MKSKTELAAGDRACIFVYKNINMFTFSGFKKLTFTLL